MKGGRSVWNDRSLLFTAFILGLGLEIMIFSGIRHFGLFVSDAVWMDRGILLAGTLGFVALAAQILNTIHPIGYVPALTMVLLGGMWAWLGIVSAVFFLIFLLLFVLFAELWVPVKLLAAGIEKLKKRT